MKVKKAVLPVAGFGTRFLPATKVVPKELLPLLDKPLIQYAVEEAVNAGIEEILFIISRGKCLIEDHFDVAFELEAKLLEKNKITQFDKVKTNWLDNINISFIRQKYALGLGNAIYAAKNFINNEPFAVLLPDEVMFEENVNQSYLKNMIDIFENNKGEAIVMATKEVDPNSVSSYGIFDVNGSNKDNKEYIEAVGIVEKPSKEEAPSNYANIGRYVLPHEIFDYLEKATPTKDNEIQLTDSIDSLLQQKKLYAYIFKGDRHDCGNPLGMLEASISKALSTPEFKDKTQQILNKFLK